MIVGEAAAGKTTLARRVKDPEAVLPTDDDSTKGIDITAWEFDIANSDKPFRLNVWDFGGHQIYHATHQFFLTARSLYALVVDARKDHTDLDYWLNVVGVLSENSPLLIVLNEKAGRRPDIDEGRLRERFSNIVESRPVDFGDNTGLDRLRETIRRHARHLPHVGDKLPATWVDVRAELEKQGQSQNHISFEDYAQICRDNGIHREGDIAQLSGYLHDLGICLHFRDDPVLKHTVILRPEWCTDAVYQVLDNHDVIDNTGRFSLSNLDEIWDSPKYADMRDGLLRMMLNFKLCYEVPNRAGHYVAPQLLSHETPQYDWDETDNLVLRFEYGFMPRGIIHRFIVAMNEDILDGDCVWRTGVVLHRDNTQAEVIEDRGSRTITIRVAGKYTRDTMTVVAYELERIHASFPGLKYEMHIPCNCKKCCDSDAGAPCFYRFDELRRFMLDGQTEIQCRNSYQMIPVRALIDDTIDIRTLGSESPTGQEGTMSIRDPGSGQVINLTVQTGDVSQSVSQDVKQEQTTNVQIDLKVDLPSLQGEFEELLELLAGANPELRPRLAAAQDAIDELAPNSTPESFNKPMNKLARVLKDIGDENSECNKIIRGAKKSIAVVRKLGKTYNKFAQWLALPQVPDVFLGG